MQEQTIIVKNGETKEEVEAVATRLFRWGYKVQRETEEINGKKYKSVKYSK